MSGLQRLPLRSLVADNGRASAPPSRDRVWNLNLDQIESDSGQVLSKQMVSTDDLGTSTFPFEAGTVLYSKLRPYLNKVVVADDAGVATTELVPLRCSPEKLLPQYLAYFLRSTEFVQFATTVVAGAKMPRMVMSEFWDYKIPVPGLAEQRRITTILDQADAIRAKRREALAQIDHLTQSIFIEMFGDPAANPLHWPWEPLGSIASKFSDGPFGSNLKSEHYVEEGVRVIRLQNIGVGTFVDDDKAFISKEHYDVLKKHECVPGDILVGTMGDPNLRACLLPDSIPLAINKADCVQIRVNPTLADSAFICSLLNMPSTEQLAQSLKHGQTRVRISMGSLRGLDVPIPPLDLQRTFAARLVKADEVKASQSQSFSQLESLFRSLQHRAFNGEL